MRANLAALSLWVRAESSDRRNHHGVFAESGSRITTLSLAKLPSLRVVTIQTNTESIEAALQDRANLACPRSAAQTWPVPVLPRQTPQSPRCNDPDKHRVNRSSAARSPNLACPRSAALKLGLSPFCPKLGLSPFSRSARTWPVPVLPFLPHPFCPSPALPVLPCCSPVLFLRRRLA